MIEMKDIILLQDKKNHKGNAWKMVIVEKLIRGTDNEIRGANG